MGSGPGAGETGGVTSSTLPASGPASLRRRLLGTLTLRGFFAEYAWLWLTLPLTLLSLITVLVVLGLGLWLSPILVGVLILAGGVQYARWLGSVHRRLARGLLGVSVPAPRRPELQPGLWNWVKTRIGDSAGWRALGYFVLRIPLSAVGGLLTVMGTMYGLAATSYAFLWFPLRHDSMPVFDIQAQSWVGALVWTASGVAVLIGLAWVVHGVTTLDRLLVVALLGQRGLSERVRALEESRATAVEDAALRLRRIERDLHDGAQAQLVALAMKLGLAKDELDGDELDVAQVRGLVTAAHANAKQALTELRDLARGIHPAALDAGLDIALSTLVASAGIEARITVDLPHRPPPSLETIVYFSAAELLTNAAKHAKSTVLLHITETSGALLMEVTDEGLGGARIVPGGGLAGVVERLKTVDGELLITSPAGGPTRVTARVPLPR